MARIKIKLLKPLGKHKAGAIVFCTAGDIRRLELQEGVDHQTIGTDLSPNQTASDLADVKARKKTAKP